MTQQEAFERLKSLFPYGKISVVQDYSTFLEKEVAYKAYLNVGIKLYTHDWSDGFPSIDKLIEDVSLRIVDFLKEGKEQKMPVNSEEHGGQ